MKHRNVIALGIACSVFVLVVSFATIARSTPRAPVKNEIEDSIAQKDRAINALGLVIKSLDQRLRRLEGAR